MFLICFKEDDLKIDTDSDTDEVKNVEQMMKMNRTTSDYFGLHQTTSDEDDEDDETNSTSDETNDSSEKDEDKLSEVNYNLPPFKILAQQARRKGVTDNKGSFYRVFIVISVLCN